MRMIVRRFSLALSIGALTLTIADAARADWDRFKSGIWYGKTIRADAGEATGCQLLAGYPGGYRLQFVRPIDGGFQVVVTSGRFNATEGDRIAMQLSINGVAVGEGEAIALSRSELRTDLVPTPQLYRQLTSGAWLTMQNEWSEADFELAGLEEALALLDQCAEHWLAQ